MPALNSPSSIKDKIFYEIDQIPEDKIPEIYDFIHYFRIGLSSEKKNYQGNIMSFSGAWEKMPNKEFDDFLEEIKERRQTAFIKRRNDATGID